MIDRWPRGPARQRIGTALSRQLPGTLRASRPHSTTAPILVAAASGREQPELESQPSTNTDSAFLAPLDTRQANPGALAPLPEPREFRVYSPLGYKVQIISPMGEVEVGNRPMATEDENQPEVSTDEVAGLPELLNDPPRRRSWLLAKALETHPLEQALDLARVAEAFITGAPAIETTQETAASDARELTSRTAEAGVSPAPQAKTQRARLVLSHEDRERLLARLAQGARNAELASQFNLSPKQVQGIRIGSAREISRRRNIVSDQG